MVKRIMFLTNKECIPFIHSKAPVGRIRINMQVRGN